MTVAPACSGSPRESARSWRDWIAHAPQLVAESLEVVRDPLIAGLVTPPVATPQSVAAGLARALLPAEAGDDPPRWLRTDQRLSFARALATARECGGVLVADGVGTGKTYIGLAVAAAIEPAHPIHVLAPATLRSQWMAAAGLAGLRIQFHSHETLSRGRPPAPLPGAVVIDESHRLRTPATKRYATVAPWLVGRRGVLLSATPVVNRLEDVVHQLSLLVRPEALELELLVVTGEDRSTRLPERRSVEIHPVEPADSPFEELRAGIGQLVLSAQVPVAGLLRIVFWHALASSPAAVADALRRYHALLLHARDAGRAGAPLSRSAIRRMVGAEADQLVLWPLVAEDPAPPELALEDLDQVGSLERLARSWCLKADAKAACLARLCGDGKRTLVFTTLTATVRHLRAHLGRTVAWCTGRGAGYGHQPVPRNAVLDWFRTAPSSREAGRFRPGILIATDVAAEGLDLPLLERVVHYDLPWTAVRLEQRSGRAIRLGTTARAVELVEFRAPPELEATLRRQAMLETKSQLPAHLGLGATPDAPWRVRAGVAAAWAGIAAREGVAGVPGNERGVIAAFRIVRPDGQARERVVARVGTGWTTDIATIARLLETAHGRTENFEPSRRAMYHALGSLRPLIRHALRQENGKSVGGVHHGPAERSALRRLVRHARDAARRRQFGAVWRLERGIAVLRSGHTAGERKLIEQRVAAPIEELLAGLPIPTEQRNGAARAEIIGLLFVEPRLERC